MKIRRQRILFGGWVSFFQNSGFSIALLIRLLSHLKEARTAFTIGWQSEHDFALLRWQGNTGKALRWN
jgi:hypothetical protein